MAEILQNELHPADIAQKLKELYQDKKIEQFYEEIEQISHDILGDVILELPEKLKDKMYERLSDDILVDILGELETDDATDILQDIEDQDKQKAQKLLGSLDQEDQDDIKWLKRYSEDEAGAFMQTELFEATLTDTIAQSIENLKKLKLQNDIENVHQIFITNNDRSLVAVVTLEELLIQDFSKTYQEIIDFDSDKYTPISVNADDDINDIVKIFEKYDLSVLAVTGYKERLLGRITNDDIYDIIQESATEQIYNLAGVNEEVESEEKFWAISRKRITWLSINLITAILVSVVIGFYDKTIEAYVALAVLMPIIASMGGNAGTQTLAVVVRQLALGEVDLEHSKIVILKEAYLALLNGFVFSFVAGSIAYFWYNQWLLGAVMALSMIINLFSAGFFGTVIPLILKKFEIDPAIGSTVILTTITDVVGFFSFLALASYFLI